MEILDGIDVLFVRRGIVLYDDVPTLDVYASSWRLVCYIDETCANTVAKRERQLGNATSDITAYLIPYRINPL